MFPSRAVPPAAAAHPFWRQRVPQLLWALLPAALLVALAVYTVQSSRTLHEHRAMLLSQNLASALSHSLAADIEKIDVAVSLIADLAQRQLADQRLDPALLDRVVQSQRKRHPVLSGIRVVDAAGDTLVGETLMAVPPLNLADRDWFQQQRDATTDRLVISAPLPNHSGDGSMIAVTRRFTDAQQRFAGVVSAVLPLAALDRQLQAIDVGASGAVMVRDAAHRVLVRHTRDAAPTVLAVGSSNMPPSLRQAIDSGASMATLPQVMGLDGVVRTVTFQTLRDLPLRVVVGLAQQDYLADWQRERRLVAGATAAILLLYAAGMALLWRASARMRGAQQRVRLLADAFEHAGEALTVCDAEHRIVTVNPAFERLHGWTVAELVGVPIQDVRTDPPGRPGDPEIRRTLIETGQWRGERLGLHRDGHSFPLLVTVIEVRDDQGRVLRHIGSAVDITDRKRASDELAQSHQALQQMQQELHQALRVARAGSFRIDVATGRWSSSETLDAILGVDVHFERDLPHWGTLLTAGHESRVARQYSHLLKRPEGRLDLECEILRPVDGQRRWLHVLGQAERDDMGRPVAVRGLVQDITERKTDALELERHRAHLEDLVALRTQELEAARQVAEEANRAKSDFLANMSHEIRTPMNAIIGLNYLLRRDSATPTQLARLEKIERAGQHLMAIVNDTLDLSKIEAGRMQLAQGSFQLQALLDHVQSMVAEAARAKGLWLQVHCDAAVGWLRGDATRLRQALLNYAANAVKFTDHGGITLRAELLGEDDAGLRLRFAVQDTGIGIDAAKCARLFVPFEQADHTISRRYGGTGLGLVITRRLAELMGGEAGVHSQPGQGSTFWFTACLQRGQGADAATDPDTLDAERQLRARHAGTRVLVAEDNAVNREVVEAMLHAVHLVVDVAVDGHAAVAMARAGNQALVLMDVQMPGLDGLQATRAIRAMPGWARRPILALTANAFDDDRLACSRAGMDDFIAKPMDVHVLYTTLLKWLDATSATPKELPPASGAASGVAAAPAADAVEAGTDDVLRRLADLPGLNLTRGLAMLRGQGMRYAGLLRRFSDHHASDALRMSQALQRGDEQQVRQLAHTLRGAASTLGADAIAEATAALEAIDFSAPDAQARQHAAVHALAAAQAALAQALAGPRPSPA